MRWVVSNFRTVASVAASVTRVQRRQFSLGPVATRARVVGSDRGKIVRLVTVGADSTADVHAVVLGGNVVVTFRARDGEPRPVNTVRRVRDMALRAGFAAVMGHFRRVAFRAARDRVFDGVRRVRIMTTGTFRVGGRRGACKGGSIAVARWAPDNVGRREVMPLVARQAGRMPCVERARVRSMAIRAGRTPRRRRLVRLVT